MKTPRWFYEILYNRFRAPWDIGPRNELVQLIESGRIKPCKVIDLGSGTASNSIFLAKHGFQVTGVDFASAAVDLGKKRAAEAGVIVDFVQDDLTNLKNVLGSFELLVDYGTLDDLHPRQRDLYLQNVLPLTHPGSLFVLYCFEWQPRGWERLVYDRMALRLNEAYDRFGRYFEIEKIAGEQDLPGFPRGWAVYLMKRNETVA